MTIRRRLRAGLRASTTKATHACVAFASSARRVRSSAIALPASVLLLGVAVTLPILTFSAAFAVSDRVTAGDIWLRKGYFLSAAIDLPPASNFGSLGLTITLWAFTGVVIVRHHVVAARLAQMSPQPVGVQSTHRVSLVAALAAALGGHGVAAYQHQADNRLHNAFAAIFVLSALLHFVLESTLERRAGLSSRLARGTRLVLCWVSIIGCATFILHVCIEESAKTPIGIGKLRAALAEILTCLCFLVYIATYSRSFHETRITLSVSYTPETHHAQQEATDASGSPMSKASVALPSALQQQVNNLFHTQPSSERRMRRSRSAGDTLSGTDSLGCQR